MIVESQSSLLLKWPQALSLEFARPLEKAQVQKVAAVALACLALFGAQLLCSWTVTMGIALICSTITWISEKFLRTDHAQQMNWMNSEIRTKRILIIWALFRLLVAPTLIALMTASGAMPIVQPALQTMAKNLRMIFLVALVAPISEEIFFRGFIQERLEDLTTLVHHYVYPLPEAIKKSFGIAVQSLCFGALHLPGLVRDIKMIGFCVLSTTGYCLTRIKNKDRSLLSPIAFHAAQNTGVVLGLLGAQALARSVYTRST